MHVQKDGVNAQYTRTVCRTIALLFVLFTAYAVLRYNVAKGEDWAHFPAYILNKSIAWTGIVLVGISRWVRCVPLRKKYGLAGLAFIGVHVPLSMVTLNPGYHPRLFAEQGMRLQVNGELSMLAGAIGFMLMIWLYGATLQASNSTARVAPVLVPRLGRLTLVFAIVHVGALGFPTWLKPGDWYAGLPPITLWAVLAAVVFLFLPRRKGERPE